MIPRNEESYSKGGTGTETLERLEGAVAYNQWIVDHFAPFLGARNLEIGAGRGAITRIVSSTAFVDLLDPAVENQKVLQALISFNERIQKMYAAPEEIPFDQSYDAAYSSNVLEHIEDDAGELAKYLRTLVMGGKLIALVPAGGSLLYSRFDRLVGHFRRYSYRDKNRLAVLRDQESRKADLVHFRFLNPIGALGWLMIMKIRRKTDIDTAAVKGSELLLPCSELLSRARLPIGQSILMVWERTE